MLNHACDFVINPLKSTNDALQIKTGETLKLFMNFKFFVVLIPNHFLILLKLFDEASSILLNDFVFYLEVLFLTRLKARVLVAVMVL